MYRSKDHDKAEEFKTKLASQFEIRDLGDARWFLGVEIIRDRPKRRTWLSQKSYCTSIAKKYALDNLRGAPATPLSTLPLEPSTEEDMSDPKLTQIYQGKAGSILYAAITLRPDVAFSASRVCQFMSNPGKTHMEAANRCIQYLHGTRQLALVIEGSTSAPVLEIYTDAAFADNVPDRHSTQGYIITLYGTPVAWRSAKQDTVTTSSTEAELLALTYCAKEALALMRLFQGMQFVPDQEIRIWCDNTQTIRLLEKETPRIKTALKHVDIHTCWARQEVQRKTFSVHYLETAKMLADGLTKRLEKTKHRTFVQQLRLVPLPD